MRSSVAPSAGTAAASFCFPAKLSVSTIRVSAWRAASVLARCCWIDASVVASAAGGLPSGSVVTPRSSAPFSDRLLSAPMMRARVWASAAAPAVRHWVTATMPPRMNIKTAAAARHTPIKVRIVIA